MNRTSEREEGVKRGKKSCRGLRDGEVVQKKLYTHTYTHIHTQHTSPYTRKRERVRERERKTKATLMKDKPIA